MSRHFGSTLRQAPAEAETVGHQLLLRAGFIDQLFSGVYSYLPLGLRVKRRVEQVIREEMDRAGGQEVMLPTIQPAELWERSGRAAGMGDVLFRLEDRRQRPLVLGPTHEEVVTRLFQDHARSYRDLPVTLYQIQTKFRDETRPRGGLVRVREFTMKDAYSFDADEAGLDRSYDDMFQAYTRIYERCQIPTVPVEADSGAIGGKGSQEFIFLTPTGEDTILQCDRCGYAANQEKAEFVPEPPFPGEPLPMARVETPGVETIEALASFLGIEARQTAKAVFMMATPRQGGDPVGVFAVVRGDHELNPIKLANVLDAREVVPMTAAELASFGLVGGSASPVALEGPLTVVADRSVERSPNLVGGANVAGWHLERTNYGRDWEASVVADIALATDGERCARCPDERAGWLRSRRGIEMGHVFRLGQTYSNAFGVTVQGEGGEPVVPVMGCYGIGVGRIFAAAVEAHHDARGIIWPAAIAPYDLSLVALGIDRDPEVAAEAEALYRELTGSGLEVLLDDRDERPGVKFNDADLLGIPIRLTVSSRNHERGLVELKRRDSAEAEHLTPAELTARILEIRRELLVPLS